MPPRLQGTAPPGHGPAALGRERRALAGGRFSEARSTSWTSDAASAACSWSEAMVRSGPRPCRSIGYTSPGGERRRGPECGCGGGRWGWRMAVGRARCRTSEPSAGRALRQPSLRRLASHKSALKEAPSMPATDSRDRCNQRHAEAAKPCEESPQPAARNAAGPSTHTRQSGATAIAATSPAIGLPDMGCPTRRSRRAWPRPCRRSARRASALRPW